MSTIKNWIKSSGSYKISEETTGTSLVPLGTKFLENTTAGTTAIQSKQAYGEWEWDVYKGADANAHYTDFIGSEKTLSGNAYVISFNQNELLALVKLGVSNLFTTANSYLSNNTWYKLKVARLQSEGVFKDIETLQTSDLVNGSYDSFTSYGRYGFNASDTGTGTGICGTADEISIVTGVKYLVQFDLKLNSGTLPSAKFDSAFAAGSASNTVTCVSGRNSHILTATSTTTGVFEFFSTSTATDYEISGLTIRRIYPANTFAVFIKGGSFGDDWTLVDTTGGSGSNPVTDATYTTSEYLVADLDAGDRIANLKITNGVKQ